MDARLILDPPAAGDWNMALDEALLVSAAESKRPVLRFYEWSEPTLSLGYFQSYDERTKHSPSLRCPCVRRSTGGGAIVHDRELTYSLIVPVGLLTAKDAKSLYPAVHGCLVGALGARQIVTRLADVSNPLTQAGEPFLCFERRAAGDVLLGAHKVAGSAQRRRLGAVLQHGSILLAKSRAAPELPGVLELSGEDLSASELACDMSQRLGELLGWKWLKSALNVEELALAVELRALRFSSSAWSLRR